MLTSDAKRKLIAFGIFALPIGLVKVAATMLGGPGGAQAQTTFTVAPPPPPNATTQGVTLTPREQTVVDRIARLDDTAFGPTPMLHARTTGRRVVDPSPQGQAVPEFRVKAILISSTGNRALIDGRAWKVGERLGDTGWIIIDINGDTRSVTIQEPETGRVTSSRVEGPDLD